MRRFAYAMKPRHQNKNLKKKTQQNSNTPNLVRRYRRHMLPQPFLMHNRNLNRINLQKKLQTGQRTVSGRETKYKSFDAAVDVKTNAITDKPQAGLPISRSPPTLQTTGETSKFQNSEGGDRQLIARLSTQRTKGAEKRMGRCVQRGIEEHGAEGTKGDGGMGGT